MKIKLTDWVWEKDKDGASAGIKTTLRVGKDPLVWSKGLVIEVSEATGDKLIGRGQAEQVQELAADVLRRKT